MENILDIISTLLSSEKYGLICTILIIVILIYLIINKIKYKCLEKISNFVAEVEKNTELTGEQKFNLVKQWISTELKVTNNRLWDKLLNRLIQYTYENSKSYAVNYIVRKSGCSADQVSSALDLIKNQVDS